APGIHRRLLRASSCARVLKQGTNHAVHFQYFARRKRQWRLRAEGLVETVDQSPKAFVGARSRRERSPEQAKRRPRGRACLANRIDKWAQRPRQVERPSAGKAMLEDIRARPTERPANRQAERVRLPVAAEGQSGGGALAAHQGAEFVMGQLRAGAALVPQRV